ncbi:DinB family protein [Thermoactinomyces sp. DSM 45892]|uniref:DinB family protein n=1 Tax=Thermoactinomyces sp. DSM 45892 TaxID=1882753 RepID=UPI0008998953|nr:DinB family protein [Thermoactinomyces sp. DSM 45892]SDY76499.1 DinB superfamily protein [Thermoactinomyces sp. DSM 45892]
MTHLQQIRTALLEELQPLSNEQYNMKPDSSRWSIAQVLDHLILTERYIVSMISKVAKENELSHTPDKPIHFVADRSRKVEAPDRLSPKADYYAKEELVQKLEQTRKRTQSFIAEHKEEELIKRSMPHPALGDLNLKQYIEFIGYHEERHLTQIRELKEIIAKK